MENKDKPRICEVLGVEVGESFRVDFQSATGVLSVDSDGTLRHKDNVRCCEALCYMINNPESIHKISRWTPEEVKRAKAIKVLWPEARALCYLACSDSVAVYDQEGVLDGFSPKKFPTLKSGESVKLSDIIGGDENA